MPDDEASGGSVGHDPRHGAGWMRTRGGGLWVLRWLIALAVLVPFLSGCGDYSQLSFRQDKRLDIVAPPDRSTVHLPVTVRWTIKDFTATGFTGHPVPDHGYFALFVDRSPVPGGQTLAYVAHGDNSCRPEEGCPNRAYLSARQVYATDQTQFTLRTLTNPKLEHQKEMHTVTIVLLDGTGHRIGESAWSVTFTLERSAP